MAAKAKAKSKVSRPPRRRPADKSQPVAAAVYLVRFLRADGHEASPRRIMLAEDYAEWIRNFNRFSQATGVIAQSHRVELPGLNGDFGGEWQ